LNLDGKQQEKMKQLLPSKKQKSYQKTEMKKKRKPRRKWVSKSKKWMKDECDFNTDKAAKWKANQNK
jgi:hypothetical protein